MLVSFKKDKAFINILSDLELFISEAADKLDIDTKSLPAMSIVDNTRKYKNWNKIETVDTSNYIKFLRYDVEMVEANQNKIMLPWKGYDTSKDISIKIFLNGALLVPQLDYTIELLNDANTAESAGYYLNFGSRSARLGTSWTTGRITIDRTTTNLPTNVRAVDIAIDRFEHELSSPQQEQFFDWGAITDDDIKIEVYVDGLLYTEDNTKTGEGYYSQRQTHVKFARPVSGHITFIRYHKI